MVKNRMRMNMKTKVSICSALVTLWCASIVASQPVQVKLLERESPPGSHFEIPVTVSNAEGLAGVELVLRYDKEFLDFIAARATSLTNGFILSSSVQPGRVVISMASATGLTDSKGTLLELKFRVRSTAALGATTEIFWDRLNLFDEQTKPMLYETTDGLMKVSEVSVFPNPFTPNDDGFNDRLNFVVPDSVASQVEIKIYGVNGTMIRSFTNRDVPSLQWDGKDRNSETLGPGLYYYLILKGSEPLHRGTVTLMR